MLADFHIPHKRLNLSMQTGPGWDTDRVKAEAGSTSHPVTSQIEVLRRHRHDGKKLFLHFPLCHYIRLKLLEVLKSRLKLLEALKRGCKGLR
eukprot:g4230.t1